MGENKRFYWLKLKEDFFSEKKIKKLRKIAGGDTYVLIYLKLMLLSLEEDGRLVYENIDETFADELALALDEEKENVMVTLEFMLRYDLIEKESDNVFYLPEVQHVTGSETASTRRSRESRKRKALQCNTIATDMQQLSNNTQHNCNTEIEKELELDIELELEKETEKELETDCKSMSMSCHDKNMGDKDKDVDKDLDLEKTKPDNYFKIKNKIHENVGYEKIKGGLGKTDLQELDEIVELMVEIVLVPPKRITIGGQVISTEMLRQRLLKLKYEHIDFAIRNIRTKSAEISRLKEYTVAVLYNSYTTYRVDVNNNASVVGKGGGRKGNIEFSNGVPVVLNGG